MFHDGGPQVAYHDTSSGNSGGAFRDGDVDIEATTDSGGGYNVGWVTAGEWLAYTVNVTIAGRYTVDVRVASLTAGGTFHIEANGADITGPMTVPSTGDWQAWTTVRRPGVTLARGIQVLRLVVDSVAIGARPVGNFNWIRAMLTSTDSKPFTGTPVTVPGILQAEDWDHGGGEVAFHDTSAGNSGGAYRDTDVDLESTSDAGGGYNVGWITAGEWLAYTVSVVNAGKYNFDIRVASRAAGGTFHIEANGEDVTGPLAIPSTGSWQTWTTLTRAGVTLGSGVQMLRFVIDSVSSGASSAGNFNWMRITAY